MTNFFFAKFGLQNIFIISPGIGIGWHKISGIGIGWNFGISTSLVCTYVLYNLVSVIYLRRSKLTKIYKLKKKIQEFQEKYIVYFGKKICTNFWVPR